MFYLPSKNLIFSLFNSVLFKNDFLSRFNYANLSSFIAWINLNNPALFYLNFPKWNLTRNDRENTAARNRKREYLIESLEYVLNSLEWMFQSIRRNLFQ